MSILSRDAMQLALAGVLPTMLSLHYQWDAFGESELTSTNYMRQPVISTATEQLLIVYNPDAAQDDGTFSTTSPAATFSLSPLDVVAFVGMWADDGTFLGMVPCSDQNLFAFIISADLTTVICPNGFMLYEGAQVVHWFGPSMALNDVTEGQLFFVTNVTENTFNLTSTLGGDLVTFAAVGAGFFQLIKVTTLQFPGDYVVGTVTVDATGLP